MATQLAPTSRELLAHGSPPPPHGANVVTVRRLAFRQQAQAQFDGRAVIRRLVVQRLVAQRLVIQRFVVRRLFVQRLGVLGFALPDSALAVDGPSDADVARAAQEEADAEYAAALNARKRRSAPRTSSATTEAAAAAICA